MNVRLDFDANGNVLLPKFILARRSLDRIGLLSNITNVNLSDSLEDAPQISFDVYKYNNGEVAPLWDDLVSFKLIEIPDPLNINNQFFEAIVEEEEADNGVIKHVTLTQLSNAELTQIHVYGLNINTEDAIIYDDNYKPTVLYDEDDPGHSLLNRVLSFAPHYSIRNVYLAPSVMSIQRTFSFNDQTVFDSLKNIAEEIGLFIEFHGRFMNVYDAMSVCEDCGYRGMFTHTCPKCDSTNILEGYGVDTTILVTTDALGNNLTISTNTDSIANCYHLQAGDDIMTAAVRQCNPNGTGYIWSFTQEMMNEMSGDLYDAVSDYNALYSRYMKTEAYPIPSADITAYNALITKYAALDEDFNLDPITSVTGYPQLIKAWYDGLDFYYFLKTSWMPSESTDNITAEQVASQLRTALNGSTVAVGNLRNLTLSAASTAVMNDARLIANTIYEVSINTAALSGTAWTGTIRVKNFYDEEDTAITGTISVTINDNYQAYVSGKVMKTLYNTMQGQSTVVAMFSQTIAQVEEALQYYSLDELVNINKSFNGAIEVLSKFKADVSTSELYTTIYLPTKAKLDAVQAEMVVRENEVDFLSDFIEDVFDCITDVQTTLNFQNYLTNIDPDLWVELNSFRREANFSDDNYVSTTFRRKFSYQDSQFISDSLTNSEIIQRAYEFLIQAEQKLNENNQYSYQINSSLKNLLVIPGFSGLRDYFECGNWIRVKTTGGELYKLRLISFEMNFDDPESLTVSFSDVTNTSNIRSAQQIIAQSVNLVKNQKRNVNLTNSKFTGITDDIQCDYVYNDSFNKDNIEILSDDMTTSFDVLDGLIQGKISQGEAMSLIQQELGKITLSVKNGEYILVTPVGDEDPSEKGWYEQSTQYGYRRVYPEGTENPQLNGWYEKVNNVYVLTTDTEVDPDKEYYVRGIQYVYTPTTDTTVSPYKDYYEHDAGESSIEIFYDGVAITTSGVITLGGVVVFTNNLTDGETVISGNNIQTGVIQSTHYHYTSEWYEMVTPEEGDDPSAEGWYEYDEELGEYVETTDTEVDDTKIYYVLVPSGNVFSDEGSKFDLETGEIQTPGMFVDGEGNSVFRGTIMAEDGYIGGSKIMTYGDSGSGAALDFSNTAWKLRSAKVDKVTGERYYTFLTNQKNLYVVNSEKKGHNGTNDRTYDCSIGSRRYPWGKGYYRKLRLTSNVNEIDQYYHNVIPEGTPYDLSTASADWTHDSTLGIYYQVIQFDGLKMIASNQIVSCYPSRGDAKEFYRTRLFCYVSNTGELTFLAEDKPTKNNDEDMLIFIVAEDYSSPEDALDGADFDASFDNETGLLTCYWDSPDSSSIFLNWQQDELIIEKYNENTGQYEQVYSEVSATADEYKDDPLVIGE